MKVVQLFAAPFTSAFWNVDVAEEANSIRTFEVVAAKRFVTVVEAANVVVAFIPLAISNL